jgi:putative transposase
VTARERRLVVRQVQAAVGISERRVVRFTGFARSSVRYRCRRDPQEALQVRIRELAGERKRWGYRMIHLLLRREGWAVNRKRVQRLYREEGLAVRRRGKRRRSEAPRPIRSDLQHRNERWGMDFVSDTLSTGRRFRCLTILDEYDRECVAIHPGHSIPAVEVIRVLEQLREDGLPAVIVTDNGSEFTSRAFDAWAYSRGVKIEYIQPGKPNQNGFIERFNGTYRDQVLDAYLFDSIDEVREVTSRWIAEYNTIRPHESLGDISPIEFLTRRGYADSSTYVRP